MVSMSTSPDLQFVFDNFVTNATYQNAEPHGSGHINDTFLISTTESNKHDYIVQRINHEIFKDVPGLMENITRVTVHLHQKLAELPDAIPDRESLTVIPSTTGLPYYLDPDGNYWRMYIYLDHTKYYNVVPNAELAKEGGKAFGRFQRLLADIPGGPLNETIPRFHDIDFRLDQLAEVLEKDPKARAAHVALEIEFIEQRFEEMRELRKLQRSGEIPTRVTHNDTKFNNVLLDENDKGLCVIDLDTVMPGLVHYDFGDCLRTAANTAEEDEPNLDKVSFDIKLFKGFTQGFLAEVRDTLNATEIKCLVLGAKLMPFIIGLRFLTDYIDGDNYFKTHRKGHNLDRARVQFRLVESIEEQELALQQIVMDCMTGH